APLDEAEGGGVPEDGGATVAEQHLVAVRQREELVDPVAEPADHELDRRLPVAGAQVLACLRGECRDGLGTDLGRATPEPAVVGKQVVGDGNLWNGHHGQSSESSGRFPLTVARVPV